MDVSPKAGAFQQVSTPSTPDPIPVSSPPNDESRGCLQKLLRSWMVTRWSLSRCVFSVPIPLLTTTFDVKKGDLVLTLPVVLLLVVINTILAGSRSVGGSGSIATYGLLLVYFFAIRNNLLLLEVTGISFERAIFYHKLFAYTTIVLSLLHGLAYVLANNKGEEDDEDSKVLSGTVMMVAMVLLYTMSLSFIRRRFFELFMKTHWILFLVVIFVGIAHGASLALVGFVPWVVDLLFRLVYRSRMYKHGAFLKKKNVSSDFVRSGMGVIASDQVSVVALPGGITRISFPRVRKDTGEVFIFSAGQYAFLCIPSISKIQWHPFTISSAPHEDIVSIYIKASGDWTNQLYQVAQNEDFVCDLLVDGPYGRVSVDIENREIYSHFALFAGGIGVTLMRSIVNWLHYERYTLGRSEIKRVEFVWSVPNHDAIKAMMNNVVPNGEECAAPVGYFPREILRGNAGSAFHNAIYVTKAERDVEDPVNQQLGGCLQYGSRFEQVAILRALGEQAKQDGKDRVAVLVCGPKAMTHAVIETSLPLSKEMKVQFDVHTEFFEF
ncbi:Ferric reduction oxidase 3 [Phytophthora citrophthora]|uniref:Ferric reduction oxidase 3 n=1 Tax=Phytophthora citrophthora TaxID=4793 RepID=A0AAD9LMH1_9STRA|nr:Ferric reduction oxidase 3 [Phytophthora citrophthora]